MTRTRTSITFDYLTQPSNPEEFLDVYHEPDDPPRTERYSPHQKRVESFKRTKIRNQLRALLITIQPDCCYCGMPLQVTDSRNSENYANLVTWERKLACYPCAHRAWKERQDVNREQKIEELFQKLAEMK